MFPIRDYLIKLNQIKLKLIIICAHVTMLLLLNLLRRGSIAVHSTQTTRLAQTPFLKILYWDSPNKKENKKQTEERHGFYSRITIAIIVLLCLFVIISLIYVAFTYQSKGNSIILLNSDLFNTFSRNGLVPTYDLLVFELMHADYVLLTEWTCTICI